MKRNPIWPSILAFGLLLVLATGCAKKQVVSEGDTEAGAAASASSATSGSSASSGSAVRESTLTPRAPSEPPPSRSAAAEPAPEAPVVGGGLSQETSAGLERIHFDFDRYNLESDARGILEQNATYLSDRPGVRVRIEGHCDERGTTEYNLALGERRANSAFQFLMDLGVDPNRMSVVSYGEESPLDARHTEEAWAQNRRAEFVELQ